MRASMPRSSIYIPIHLVYRYRIGNKLLDGKLSFTTQYYNIRYRSLSLLARLGSAAGNGASESWSTGISTTANSLCV